MKKREQPIKKYPSKKGYLTTSDGNYVSTPKIKLEIAELMYEGKTNAEIRNKINERYGVSKDSLVAVITSLNKEMLAKKDEMLMAACAKNVGILQKVVSECMKAGRYKEVISAVAELNKMSGLLPDQTIVVNNYGFQFGTEEAQEVQAQEAIVIEPINEETGLE